MKGLIKSPKTAIGALIALAGVIMLATKQLDITGSVTLIGIGATWLGITAKDFDKSGGKQ